MFDQALWIFSALDFVPHVYAGSAFAETTPVILAPDTEKRSWASDVLLTLDDDAPPDFENFFARYERVIEVVSCDNDDRGERAPGFQASIAIAAFSRQHLK